MTPLRFGDDERFFRGEPWTDLRAINHIQVPRTIFPDSLALGATSHHCLLWREAIWSDKRLRGTTGGRTGYRMTLGRNRQ